MTVGTVLVALSAQQAIATQVSDAVISKMTSAEAHKACAVDDKLFRIRSGFDGSVIYEGARDQPNVEMKRQIGCLQRWARFKGITILLLDYDARMDSMVPVPPPWAGAKAKDVNER